MDKKIVQFNPALKKEHEDKVPVVRLGTIYLDLLISCDGNSIYFRPSFELGEDISDEYLDAYANMLKANFSEAIDQLFQLYQSSP